MVTEETDIAELTYDAACPGCGGLARWAAVRESRYHVVALPAARMWMSDALSFRIDCPACP